MSVKESLSWAGMHDGPWPSAYVGGDLELAEREWLHTNDIGTYSMSTLALMHTRRQHGLLVTRLTDDPRRFVVLSHMEMTLEAANRTHSLSTHQFPNVAPTLGYRALESFTQDPLPRWVYRFPSGTVERTVSLVRGRRAVIIALTWQGKKPARLWLRPLMPMRPSDEVCQEHGAMLQKVILRSGAVSVQPVSGLPEVCFQHDGVFMGSPDWWRKFEYLQDRGRYEDFQEDMWSPGIFELVLSPRETQYLIVSADGAVLEDPGALVMEAAQARLSCDLDVAYSSEVRALSVAAETFVEDDGRSVCAGYPWLDTWSRDTLLSVTGLYLARGQVERAKKSYRHLLGTLDDGLLPQRPWDVERRQVSADASLWLFEVGDRIHRADPKDVQFRDELVAGLLQVFERITSTRREFIWVNPDGLVENSAAYPLTWMDSAAEGVIYARRAGLAIELEALWIRALCVLNDLSVEIDDDVLGIDVRARREQAISSFGARFWCQESSYPFDCVSAAMDTAEAWADPSIRPNALIALALAPELFEPWQRLEILSKVEERLLTPMGIRSLDPSDRSYIGHAGGTIEERRAAGHRGAVWPHLMLYYVRASLREGRAPAELRERLSEVLSGGLALGHVAQTADGDAPHRRRGSPAYSIATSMILEALVVDLKVGVEGRTLW